MSSAAERKTGKQNKRPRALLFAKEKKFQTKITVDLIGILLDDNRCLHKVREKKSTRENSTKDF